MHMGKTTGPDLERPLFRKLSENGKLEGAQNQSGKVRGTYFHGLFQSDEFRKNFLTKINSEFVSQTAYKTQIEETLDELANHLAQSLNMKKIEKLSGL